MPSNTPMTAAQLLALADAMADAINAIEYRVTAPSEDEAIEHARRLAGEGGA